LVYFIIANSSNVSIVIRLSQCSTVVRNIVVRSTIKVNGKPQILGTRSPQTPESIDLGYQHSSFIFSSLYPPKPKILGPFSDFEKLQLKMLNNGDAHLQTTLNCHRSLTKVA